MDTILVTGANGFFASRFIDYYKDKYNIVGLSHLDLDITNEEAVFGAVSKYCPRYLVHAAAISDTGMCERNPELSFAVNVKGTINIAKGCLAASAKLIYLSSDQVYNGNIEEGPYSEDIIAVPNTVYGNHKMQAENEILKIIDNSVILRLTWLFSLPERQKKTNSNIIWNIVKAAMKSEQVRFPVHEYRGITYVYDLIENFDKIMGLPSGIYNTGSENNKSTYEVAEIIVKQLGLVHRIDELLFKDTERFIEKKRDLRISNEKLKNHKIEFISTEETVSRCIDEYRYSI